MKNPYFPDLPQQYLPIGNYHDVNHAYAVLQADQDYGSLRLDGMRWALDWKRLAPISALAHDIDPVAVERVEPPRARRTAECLERIVGHIPLSAVEITVIRARILRTDFPWTPQSQAEYIETLQNLMGEVGPEGLRQVTRACEMLALADKTANYLGDPRFALRSTVNLRAEGYWSRQSIEFDITSGTEFFLRNIALQGQVEESNQIEAQARECLGVHLKLPKYPELMGQLPPGVKRQFDNNLALFRRIRSEPEAVRTALKHDYQRLDEFLYDLRGQDPPAYEEALTILSRL